MERPTVATNCQQICAPLVDPEPDRAAPELKGIAISCFVNEVPPFAEAEMENLYGSFYSSLTNFRIYGGVGDASTYVVRKDGKVIVVFLFRLDKGRVQVMNEVIKIDEEEIRRFSETIFLKFKSVSVISFNAIQTDTHTLPFPFQRFNCLEDIVIALPGSAEEYLASLGNATRQNIKRYTNKLKRNFPSFSYQFYEKEGATEQHIRDIIRLKLARMADKNKVSGINKGEVDRILALVKECGGVGVAMIDGRVCGGLINYRVGTNDFLSVIAHDPEYNDYRLGMICFYLTMRMYNSRRKRVSPLMGAGRVQIQIFRGRAQSRPSGCISFAHTVYFQWRHGVESCFQRRHSTSEIVAVRCEAPEQLYGTNRYRAGRFCAEIESNQNNRFIITLKKV